MKIDELKQKVREIEKKQNELRKEIERLEKEKIQVKLQVAECVLNEDTEGTVPFPVEEPEDNTRAFVKVEFTKGGKTYDYLWNEKEPPGEYVIVSTYRSEQERVRVLKYYRAVPQANIKYKVAEPIKE